MATSKQDINDFNARLRRIKNPRNKSYYDPDMGMHVPKRVSRDKIRKVNEEPSLLAAMIVSIVLGAFALFIAQMVRIRYFGLIEQTPTVLVIEIFVAVWAVVLLAALTDKRGMFERAFQFVGIGLMLIAGHNLIWRWPDQMATIYTSAYVDEVLETTTQHSVVVSGTVYGL